jgi:ornithine--oxo-acid transaminase
MLAKQFRRLDNSLRQFSTNKEIVERCEKHVARNYAPPPIALAKGERIYLWDVEGNKYFDFLCGYSSCNQGHAHPKIVEAMINQVKKLPHVSRAFWTDTFADYSEYATKLFGYDKILPMNSGVEACETAIKLARRWAYNVKGTPDNQAVVILPTKNFWGRSITASGACDDPIRYTKFGPFTPGFEMVPFNDIPALTAKFESDANICAYMMEPIQGEAGVIIPDDGYLIAVRDLCKKHNVLFIADEVQAGLGRTGKLNSHMWEDVRPDIIVMAKALSGGLMPISAVMADDIIMGQINPGEHGSTFGGNAVSNVVAKTALEVLVEEGMIENSRVLGEKFLDMLEPVRKDSLVKEVRGRGLFSSIEFKHDAKINGNHLCTELFKRNLITKATHITTVRLAPALVVTEDELLQASKIIIDSVKALHSY